jgi:hypothetical protein
VRELLRHRPVETTSIRTRHDGASELDLEIDVEAPLALDVQVGKRLGVLRRRRHEAVLEQGERCDPSPDGGREGLAEERPERLVLPRLDVTRAPVVDQEDAEDVVAKRGRGYRLAERATHANDEADLELDVESSTGAEARRLVAR